MEPRAFVVNAPYSAYVPCCDDRATLRRAVESVLAQSVPPAEVLVIDDASRDDSLASLAGLPVRAIRHERNLGRGAARARALREARHELVLGCDAGVALAPDFAARALDWLRDPAVAVVCGRVNAAVAATVADRWRNRHLFKLDAPAGAPLRRAALQTGGALLRRTPVAAVGGFDPARRRAEDADLGARLLAAGHDVVFDAALTLTALASDSPLSALARYWRWNDATAGRGALRGYARAVWYSWRVMVARDLSAGDWPAGALSAACPHYCALRSLLAR